MKSRTIIIKKAIAYFMLIIMGINNFGNQLMVVHATEYDIDEYEKASEEAEEEIRNAEKNAGIPLPENDGISDDNETENSELSDEEFGDDKLLKEETVQETYEDMTISGATTLKEDLEVGNLIINNTLHVNGHRIIVHGDLTINSYMYLEEGYIKIDGDIHDRRNSNIITSSVNDYILVEGNYFYDNYHSNSRVFNSGTLEIRGDILYQKTDHDDNKMKFEGTSNVVLSGSVIQTIDMTMNSGWVIQNLIISNSSEEGVLSKHMINAVNVDDPDNKLHYEAEGECGETLSEDIVIDGDFTLLKGKLDLSGHDFVINGDLIHSGGIIELNGGSLTVKGDYRRQYIYVQDEERIIENSAGILVMNKENDYMLIEGDYIDSGVRDEYEFLTAGTLEIKGNITHEDTLDYKHLQTSSNHIIKFTGSGEQIIDNKSSITFANMIIEQSESGSISWNSEINIEKSVNHISGNVTGITNINSNAQLGKTIYGTVKIKSDYDFTDDTIIHGDLYIGLSDDYSRNYSLIDCNVIVDGNCYVSCVWINKEKGMGNLVINGDIVLKGGYCYFCGGTLEVKGDIKKTKGTYFSCNENTEVKLTGSSEQLLDIPHNYSQITRLIIDNPAGVVVGDNFSIVNVTNLQGVLSYSSGGVYGFTLVKDEEYNDDLVIAGGILDLNGHTLHVNGNLTITDGILSMTNAQDHLIVDGDFLTDSKISHVGKLTDGILEVKGDFTLTGTDYAFEPTGSHTTILSGTEEQTVNLNGKAAWFNNLIIDENAITKFVNYPRACGVITQNGNVSGKLAIDSKASFKNDTYNGDILVRETVNMESDWIINGNLSLYSGNTLNLNGHNLTVGGKVDFLYSNTLIKLNGGTLSCGSIKIGNGGGIIFSSGKDVLIVTGDMIIDSDKSNFYCGKINVAGDLIVECNDKITFGTYNVIDFIGTEKQTITMNGNYHKLGKVVISNLSEEGVYVTNSLNCISVDNSAGGKVTFADGGMLGYTLQSDETIDDDIILSGGVMDLNGHTLNVRGNVTYNGGSLFLNGGTLSVEDDFNNNIALSLGEGNVDINGNWNVSGNVTADNTSINIAGDIVSETDYYSINLKKALNIIFDGEKNKISVQTREEHISVMFQ